MKKLMIFAVMAGMAVATHAQDKGPKTPEKRAELRTERMSRELALSPEQAAKVEAINRRYATEADARRADARREGREMRAAHDAEIKAVLTSDQYAKWEAKKEAMKTMRKDHRKGMQEKKGR